MILSKVKRVARKLSIMQAKKSNYKFALKDWISLNDLDALSRVLESKRFSQNLETLTIDKPRARNVLVIAPHPDDDVFSSGGTILKMIHGGCKIKVIYLTSAGQMTDEESRNVSRDMGTEVEFWDFPKGDIRMGKAGIDRMKRLYNEFHPDTVFLPFIADDHIDHRASVRLFYESFKGLKDADFEVWAYQVYSTVIPNVAVDITAEIEEKLRLIRMWKTRMASRDWAHYIRGLNAFNSRFLKTNEPRYAELFFVVPAKEYVELCDIYFGNEKMLKHG